MAPELRYYQKEAVQSIYDYFSRATGNPIVAMPTASGKSLVIGDFVRGAFTSYPGQKIIILSHSKELLAQDYKKLVQIWPTAPVGIYSAGLNRKEDFFPITIAGIASVWNKADTFGKVDLILVDECHLISPKENTMYGKFISQLLHYNPLLKVIGFTATHYRLGLGLLTEGTIFTDICFDLTSMASFNRLVKEGFLAPLITKRTAMEYDASQISVKGGEYVQHELQQAVDRADLTRAALSEMMAYGYDRKHWLIFASGVEHAEHVSEQLCSLGVKATFVHSKLGEKERDERIAGFISGKYQAISNNGILTTGFDFPEIDLIGMLRLTLSTALWVQMLGRGTRPAPGKANCLVLDFAGNTRRLGPINDPVLPRKKSKGTGTAPVKVCLKCGVYNHASVTVCSYCGEEFPRQLKIQRHAGLEDVMRLETPVIAEFKVDKITYALHHKVGMQPSIRASYYCGLNLFNEFICLEHKGFAGKKARNWWREHTETPPPQTVDHALLLINTLRVPVTIKVWLNKKYPEIVEYHFAESTTS